MSGLKGITVTVLSGFIIITVRNFVLFEWSHCKNCCLVWMLPLSEMYSGYGFCLCICMAFAFVFAWLSPSYFCSFRFRICVAFVIVIDKYHIKYFSFISFAQLFPFLTWILKRKIFVFRQIIFYIFPPLQAFISVKVYEFFF